MKRGTSQTWYTYDSTVQRMRKVTEKGGLTEERLYLGGFEIYRKRQGTTVTLERETLHLMDGARRIAMVETKTIGTTTTPLPATVTRYQLDNHLQSANLELDETASVISYEEYYPYGDTSYRSARSGVEVSEKRYRYTGKEKDEETGLYYHGARYYAAWLGRWTAADPAGMVDGACLYAYVRNHPTGLVDPDGRAATDTQDRLSSARFTSYQSRQIDEFTPSMSVEDLMSRIHENKRILAAQQARQAHAAKIREQLSRAELVFSTPTGSLGYLVSSAFTDDQDKRLAGGELGFAVGTVALARLSYATRFTTPTASSQSSTRESRPLITIQREYRSGSIPLSQTDVFQSRGSQPPIEAPSKRLSNLHLSGRHFLGSLSIPKKAGNSIFLGPKTDAMKDMNEIQTGKATKNRGTFTASSGRTWGVHENALFPISGPGVISISSQEYNVLLQAQKQGLEKAFATLSKLEEKQILSEAQISRVRSILRSGGER